jgi:DNA-binding Lrp family transcriptional regulator
VSRNEDATQSLLSKLTEIDLSTLGRIIDRMEQDGLIERHEHANDRRAHRLQLGHRARDTLIEFVRMDDRARSAVLAPISIAEQSKFMMLPQHVHANPVPLVPRTRDGAMVMAHPIEVPRCVNRTSSNLPDPGQESNERHG